MIRAVAGWMCKVDWEWELGEAAGGTGVYASRENLKQYRNCTAGDDPNHRPQEVVVLDKDDFVKIWRAAMLDEDLIYSSKSGSPIYARTE